AYLNANYDTFYDTNASGDVVNVADNRVIPHAPKWQAQGGFDWRIFSSGGADSLPLIVDTRYSSSYFLYPYAKTLTPDFPLVSAASQVRRKKLIWSMPSYVGRTFP